MDHTKSGLIQKLFMKGRGLEIPSKFRPPPNLWQPSKVLVRLLVFGLAI